MEKESRRPSMTRIVISDYLAGLIVMFFFVVWIMYIVISQDPSGSDDVKSLFEMGIAVTIIGVPLLSWRINFYRSLFERAEEVAGLITYSKFRRDRGKLEYQYEYKSNSYSSKNYVFKNGRTKVYKKGDPVTLLVDPDNPKKAVIMEIYQ